MPATSEENIQPLSFPQCIHLTERCKCAILSVDSCLGEKCPFLQSDTDYKNSQKQWQEHLNSISAEKQNQISKEYYGGKKLW